MADSEIAKQEALLKAKYGRIPAKKGPLGALRPGGGGVGDRKFFDSADYARGGKGSTGQQIATTDNITKPHAKQLATRASLNKDEKPPADAPASGGQEPEPMVTDP